MGKKHDDDNEFIPVRYKTEDALRDLDSIESLSFLPSSVMKKEEPVSVEAEEPMDMDWLDTLEQLRVEKKGYKKINDLFGTEDTSKRKKKKKKNSDGPIDHTEDFEKELTLYQDILRDQSKLSADLRKRYDQLTAQKSTARGVGKYTTDLITTMNQSNALKKDIIREMANTKKTIAELNMKEREKFGKKAGEEDGSDKGQFASSYLKRIMGVNLNSDELVDYGIDDVNSGDDFFGDMTNNMLSSKEYTERSTNAEKYIKYEKQNVEVKVMYDEENDSKFFFAEDENGDVLTDYPLPSTIDSVSINRSTGIGTDKFGQKYRVVYA